MRKRHFMKSLLAKLSSFGSTGLKRRLRGLVENNFKQTTSRLPDCTPAHDGCLSSNPNLMSSPSLPATTDTLPLAPFLPHSQDSGNGFALIASHASIVLQPILSCNTNRVPVRVDTFDADSTLTSYIVV